MHCFPDWRQCRFPLISRKLPQETRQVLEVRQMHYAEESLRGSFAAPVDVGDCLAAAVAAAVVDGAGTIEDWHPFAAPSSFPVHLKVVQLLASTVELPLAMHH